MIPTLIGWSWIQRLSRHLLIWCLAHLAQMRNPEVITALEPESGNTLPDLLLASQKFRMLRSADGGAWLGDGKANWVSLAGTLLPLAGPWCEGSGSALGAKGWGYKLVSNPFLAQVFSACLLNGY